MFEEQTRERALSSTLIRIAAVQSVIAPSKSSLLNLVVPESLKVIASKTDALIDEAKIITAFEQLAQKLQHSANEINFEIAANWWQTRRGGGCDSLAWQPYGQQRY